MADDATCTHLVHLSGLEPDVLDQFVAHKAAVNVTGPPASRDVLKPFVRHFLRWLQDAQDGDDRELRRAVLLMLTAGRSAYGLNDRDAAKLIEMIDDVYNQIA
jgi:hypothetical protein